MNKLITFLGLLVIAMPAFSGPVFGTAIPEPSMLPLLGMGVLAIAFVKRLKK